MASILNYASSGDDGDGSDAETFTGTGARGAGATDRVEPVLGGGHVGVPRGLTSELQRPTSMKMMSERLLRPMATQIKLPWGAIGDEGKVDALVAAAQKFTRDVAEGRHKPG